MADNLLQGLQAAANATSQAGVSFLLTIFLLNSSVGVRTSYKQCNRTYLDYTLSLTLFLLIFW